MSRIWAVARQMIAEGIRMKIALVFLLLLGAVVIGLPFSIVGDASLTGAVQSFMAYGFTATGFLLSLLTILMARSLSDELVNHQIFLVVTKPIPRWQYIVGKWLGITTLNLVFLTGSTLTIYGMVHYIRHTHPPIDDRYDEAELNQEVLVARHARPCKLPDFTRGAELEYERNREEGLYDSIPDFAPEAEKSRLVHKHEARWRVVSPLDARLLEFDQVLVDRSRQQVLQLRYKTEVSYYPPDEVFRSTWIFGNRSKGTPERRFDTRHVVGRYHTIRVPIDTIAPDHTLTVRFFNRNPFPDEPQFGNVIEFKRSNPVEVLFIVGSFEWNLVRLSILMFCKLMFLGAVAVLAATAFSFPVACLTSFTVYVLAGTRQFITDALDFASEDNVDMFSSVKEFFVQLVTQLYNMVHWLIPDFARYDAVETVLNGRNVSLVWVLQAVADLAAFKTVLVLGLAILLFYRREVAEISV
ncbi:MAG: hypothetical protein IID38_08460 [Planctomycetes bacterium]|nr:hypothetical protein [Planctomycetota bacterium]